MSNYLEEVKLKKERKKYLKSKFVGKKAFILIEKLAIKDDSYHQSILSIFDNSITLKQVKITSVCEDLRLIAMDKNKEKFIIPEYVAEELLILDLEHLKDRLTSLFIKRESILLSGIDKYSRNLLPKRMDLSEYFNANISVYDYIPNSKKNICKEYPIVLSLDVLTNKISFMSTNSSANGILLNYKNVVSVESFINGFYYGLDEMPDLVEDIVKYSQMNFVKKYFMQKIS